MSEQHQHIWERVSFSVIDKWQGIAGQVVEQCQECGAWRERIELEDMPIFLHRTGHVGYRIEIGGYTNKQIDDAVTIIAPLLSHWEYTSKYDETKAAGVEQHLRTYLDGENGFLFQHIMFALYPMIERVIDGEKVAKEYLKRYPSYDSIKVFYTCPECGKYESSRTPPEWLYEAMQPYQYQKCDACYANDKRICQLRAMPYKQYLQSSWWKEIRQKALEYAGHSCQVCNKSGVTLDVHHRTYERRGHEFVSDLTVLCRKCHATFHGKGGAE